MTKEEFVALAAQRYDELQALNKLDNFYAYGKEFVSIRKDLGREVLEKNPGESARRTAVQKRTKLSGQRRSKKGASHMLRLRVSYMNQRRDKVIHPAKTNFANTA